MNTKKNGICIMVISNEVHPMFQKSVPSTTRGSYRWYREMTDVSRADLEKIMRQHPMAPEDRSVPFSAAWIEDGIEHPGTFNISAAALRVFRETGICDSCKRAQHGLNTWVPRVGSPWKLCSDCLMDKVILPGCNSARAAN